MLHQWAITRKKTTTLGDITIRGIDPNWRKCAKCGLIRVATVGHGKARRVFYYKRGNQYVYGDNLFGNNVPECEPK